MKRVLWFVILLFVLGEVVVFLFWVAPDVVAVLVGCIGLFLLGVFSLAPERVLVAGGCPPPPPTAPDELEAMWVIPYLTEDSAATRTALYDEDDE